VPTEMQTAALGMVMTSNVMLSLLNTHTPLNALKQEYQDVLRAKSEQGLIDNATLASFLVSEERSLIDREAAHRRLMMLQMSKEMSC